MSSKFTLETFNVLNNIHIPKIRKNQFQNIYNLVKSSFDLKYDILDNKTFLLKIKKPNTVLIIHILDLMNKKTNKFLVKLVDSLELD